MKSIVLVPYCPLPVESGAKSEIWKHLDVLRSLGPCSIVSAQTRPVGMGWKPEHVSEIRSRGFNIQFREDSTRVSLKQFFGYGYGLMCKVLRLDRAFGHSNPYHRWAFPETWWWEMSKHANLAVIHYSFWAYLPSACAKVVVLHDLISNFSWEGHQRETKDLKMADLVVVISKEEEALLNNRGISQSLWSPPAVPATRYPLSARIGLLGSENPFNIEGLQWLERSSSESDLQIRVYGKLSDHVQSPSFQAVGQYADQSQPYQDCGIILMTTSGGTGVQVKAIEALAAGRAIIARKGAMRGIPSENIGWIEVTTPDEMLKWARRLASEEPLRSFWSSRAKSYYTNHLDNDRIIAELSKNYSTLML